MAKGVKCDCPEKRKPLRKRAWRITQYRSNRSAFNGYRETPSTYSELYCESCHARWRTNGAYVEALAERR